MFKSDTEEWRIEDDNADVRPERHGRWIINSDGYYPNCSACSHEPKNGAMTNFCSDCGAKMDTDK